MSAKTVKPQALAPIAGNIPADLRLLNNWILWQCKWKVWKNVGGGRWTKVPMQVNGRHAMTNTPATWASFNAVLEAYRRGGYDGIGFCFPLEGGYIGGDCDHVIYMDGRIVRWAQELVDRLGTYTEFSVSRTRLHFIVQGDVILARHRWDMGADESLELYGRGSPRFFTFTGQHLPETPAQPMPSAEVLANFVAELAMRESPKPASASIVPKAVIANGKGSYSPAVTAMLKVPLLANENDGSRRLLMYCRQAVRWGLDDGDTVKAVLEAAGMAGPFPVEYSEGEILRRVRDAEKRVTRGEALNNRGQWRSPVPPWIKREVKLRTFKLSLLRAIADLCDATPIDVHGSLGFCIAGCDALADATGMTSRTVKRNIKAMCAAGIIILVNKGGFLNNGEIAANVYAIPGAFGAWTIGVAHGTFQRDSTARHYWGQGVRVSLYLLLAKDRVSRCHPVFN